MTDPEAGSERSVQEASLAGRVSGLMWLLVVLTTPLSLLLPGGEREPLWIVLVVCVVGGAVGMGLLALVRAQEPSLRAAHASMVLLLVAVATLAGATGAHESPVSTYLILVVVYAALFHPPAVALLHAAAAAAVLALPLIYDRDSFGNDALRELAFEILAGLAVAGVVVGVRERLRLMATEASELERTQRDLIGDQSSLRRVATAVAAGLPPQAIFALVSAEAGRLLSAEAAGIARFEEPGDRVIVLGTWAEPGYELPVSVGDVYPVSLDDPVSRMRSSDAVLNLEDLDVSDPRGTRRLGWRSMVIAPVHSANRLWGAIALVDRRPQAFAAEDAERLRDYADLVATAITNAEDRARVDTQAGTDAMTGLANHRAFRERLAQEVARAQRHGRPLTVGIVDVDGFHRLNDQLGVEQADLVLSEIAHVLRGGVRDEDIVARLAGDGFGVIFVESDPAESYAATDRARALVAGTAFRHRTQATVSAGLCDLPLAASPEDLIRCAGVALQRAKAAGGDRCERYDAASAGDPAGRLRVEELDRWQAVLGLRALARAIDAKDPTTQEHSERVASLAARLAEVRGWPQEEVALLREAALLHDVGKIGVPDTILLKRGALDADEWIVMREHAALSARIVADVLEEDQIRWIASHHERPDGRGYPLGVGSDELPEGAALLALADAWDVMTRSRWYAARKTVEAAFAECRSLAGEQFTAEAFEALEVLLERNELTLAAARMHSPGS